MLQFQYLNPHANANSKLLYTKVKISLSLYEHDFSTKVL